MVSTLIVRVTLIKKALKYLINPAASSFPNKPHDLKSNTSMYVCSTHGAGWVTHPASLTLSNRNIIIGTSVAYHGQQYNLFTSEALSDMFYSWIMFKNKINPFMYDV